MLMAYYIALPGLGNVLKPISGTKTLSFSYCSYLELLCLVAESSIQLLKTVQSKIHLMLTNSIIQAYILEIILEGKYVPVDLRFVSYLGIKINAKNCSYWCPTLLAHLPVKSPCWKDVAALFYLYFVSSTR